MLWVEVVLFPLKLIRFWAVSFTWLLEVPPSCGLGWGGVGHCVFVSGLRFGVGVCLGTYLPGVAASIALEDLVEIDSYLLVQAVRRLLVPTLTSEGGDPPEHG